MEMYTIVGKNNKGAIVTIIDRSTDWLLMRNLMAKMQRRRPRR